MKTHYKLLLTKVSTGRTHQSPRKFEVREVLQSYNNGHKVLSVKSGRDRYWLRVDSAGTPYLLSNAKTNTSTWEVEEVAR